MSDWKRDKKWSDAFLPEIKKILGLYLIGEPPIEEDQQRNTDLMVLNMSAVRVGCRIRKHSYLASYADEFTIRAGRPSGTKTELTKIIEGWGDFFFYGFCDEEESALAAWMLGDLNVFRLFLARSFRRGEEPWVNKKNLDGSSSFMAFKISSLPEEFVVAQKLFSATDNLDMDEFLLERIAV